jgi:hypothetical protein
MLLLAGSLIAGFYAYAAAGRYFARDVIYIAPKRNEERMFFTPTDVELLQVSFPAYTITPVSRGGAWLASSSREASATVIYTTASYFQKHAMDFIEGKHGAENSMVINEALAWRLFGAAENITGLTVRFSDETYQITGVVRQGSEYTAWLPLAGGASFPVSSLYILPNYPDPLAETQARAMLSSHLHVNPEEYIVADINRFVESINIRHKILLYIVWFAALIFFLVKIKNERLQLVVKYHQLKLIFLILGVCLCFYVLFGINEIFLWLPNLSAQSRPIFQTITTVGMLPPDTYLSAGMLRVAQLSRFANYVFIIGIIAVFNILFFLSGKK